VQIEIQGCGSESIRRVDDSAGRLAVRSLTGCLLNKTENSSRPVLDLTIKPEEILACSVGPCLEGSLV
jgi:hypothetical protein